MNTSTLSAPLASSRMPLLKLALAADAISSAAVGWSMALASGWLAGLLALPEPLLRLAGLALLPWVLIVGWLATRERAPRSGVWVVIACNALWALDCVLILVTGQVAPNAIGTAFILVQAVAVIALAELQFIGMRRESRT